MLKPVLSASPRPDVDTPRTKERKEVCQRRLAYFGSSQTQSQPIPAIQHSRNSHDTGRTSLRPAASTTGKNTYTAPARTARDARPSYEGREQTVRHTMLRDSRVLARDDHRNNSLRNSNSQDVSVPNKNVDSQLKNSRNGHRLETSIQSHPNNTRHQAPSQASHLSNRLENNLFDSDHTATRASALAEDTLNRQDHPARHSPRDLSARDKRHSGTLSSSIGISNVETADRNKWSAHQPELVNQSLASSTWTDAHVAQSHQQNLSKDFYTDLDKEAGSRYKQESSGTRRKVSSSGSSGNGEGKSTPGDEAENFDPDNLTCVLGKDRFQRLLKNFEESDWISNVDSARQEKFNIFLEDGSTTVSPHNKLRNDQSDQDLEKEDADLGLQTHRPAGSQVNNDILQEGPTTTWNSPEVIAPPKDTVKCAFSIDEIYAEANRVDAQGFVFNSSESDTDSDPVIHNVQGKNRSANVRNSTATYVFSANAVSDPPAMSYDSPTISKSHEQVNRGQENGQLGKSLEGREFVLPRQKPYGPIPQLNRNGGEPVYKEAVYTCTGPVKQEPEVQKSADSDKHIEGVRQYVEKRSTNMTYSALPEDYAAHLPPGTFTNPSLERYFTSIERASADRASTLSSDTFEPIPDPDIEVTPREDSHFKGQQLSGSVQDIGKTASGAHPEASRDKVINLGDSRGRALQQLQGHSKDMHMKDDDLFTKVTSIVGEMEPGGLTERLKTLGIEFDFLKQDNQQKTDENTAKEDERSKEIPASQNSAAVAKICPDCSKPNKKYVTWCIECGCVLIGVETLPLSNLDDRSAENKPHDDSPGERKESAAPANKDAVLKEQRQQQQQQRLPHPDSLKPQQCTEPVFRDSGLQSSDAGRHFKSRLEQAWKSEHKVMESQDSFVSDSDRLLYSDVGNAQDSLPNHVRAELSLNVLSSTDSSLQCAGQSGKQRRTVQASCPDLGDDIEFEYSEENPRKSLPSALKVELSLNLPGSRDSTPEPNTLNSRSLDKKGKKPQRPHQRVKSRLKVSQNLGEVNEEEAEAEGPVKQEERKRDPVAEEEKDEEGDDVPVIIDDCSDGSGVDPLEEFVEHLRTDPRFKARTQDVTRPKSAGVPQLSKSMQPAKSKMRPQSAGKSGPYSSVQSKVRASIEADPPQRRWQKSSVAWSSYNSGELSKPSSRPGSRGQMRASQDLGGGDGDGDLTASLRVRPASAGAKTRSASRGQQAVDGGGDRSQDPTTRGGKGKSSAMNTYAKYLAMAKGHTGRLYKSDTHQNARDKKPPMQSVMSPRINDGKISRWLCLPDELLLYIFSFLSHTDLTKVARVCGNFRRIALDDSLWRDISLKKTSLTDDWLAQIGRHQPSSLSLVQCQGNRVTANGLRELFRQCADSLQELNCTGISKGRLTGDNMLLHAASRCRHLRRLDVSWCNVNDNGVTAVAETSDRLEVLCLNGCQSITDDAIESVVTKHGDYLQELELFGCFNLTAKGATSIATYCGNLRTLNLGQCWKLTDSCIAYLSSNIRDVEHLDLRGCKQLKDSSITQIVRNCPKLRTLSLANCPNMTDVAVGEIATYCPKIRSLDVCGCKSITNSGIKFLATCCHDLEFLDLSSTTIDSKSVSSIASYCNRKLEVIKLNFCKHINLNCLTRLAKNCKRLRKLYIYGVNGIRNTDAILRGNPQLWIEM